MSTSALASTGFSIRSLIRANAEVRSNPAWLLCFCTAGAMAVGCYALGVRFGMWGAALKLLATSAALYLLVAFCAARKMMRLAMVIDAHIVVSLIAFLSPFLICLVAMSGAPLRDAALVNLDAWLGFSWLQAATWFQSQPMLSRVLSFAYLGILFQTTLITLVLAVFRPEQTRPFTSSLAVSLALTTVIFPFVPAIGGYAHYGLEAKDFPEILATTAWSYPPVLVNAREGLIQVLDSTVLEGLIAFPSFHAVTAVIYAYYWWQIPYLRYAGLAVNGMMLVSTIPIGSHYLVDVIGGIAVAVASIWAVSRYHRGDKPIDPV